MESIARKHGAAGVTLCGMQTTSWVEDVDSDLLQEQTQSICEELQRRGACTTLALARHLGSEKSSAINPLMFLLLEKNIVVMVSDIPPIWSLSPTFPMSPHFVSNQFSSGPKSSSPLTAGFSPSPEATPFQSSPSSPISVHVSVNPAPKATQTISASGTTFNAPTVTSLDPTFPSTCASVYPSIARIASQVLTAPPVTSSLSTSTSTPALISATPTVAPAPAPAPSPGSPVIPTPTLLTLGPSPSHPPDRVLRPVLTPAATTPDPSQLLAPEFVFSRTALTFMEHVIPVPEVESESEGEDEVSTKKTSPKSPLPALTFAEHLIPGDLEEKNVSVALDSLPGSNTLYKRQRSEGGGSSYGVALQHLR